MPRLTITLILSFLVLNVYSQSTQSIGFHIGTTHSMRTTQLIEDHTDFGPKMIMNKADDNTKTQFTAGIDYTFQLTEKLGIQARISYQNLGYNVPDAYFNYPNQHDGSGAFVPHTNRVDYFSIHSISLPIQLNYKVFELNNSSVSIGAGAIFSYVLHQEKYKSYTNSFGEDVELINDFTYTFNNIQIGGIANLTYAYQFNEKYSITLAPSFAYYFTKNENNEVLENLYTFSTVVGLNHQF